MGRHHHRKCPERGGLIGDLCLAIGERVVIVIKNDGKHGAFTGTLAEVRSCDVHLVLHARKHETCEDDGANSHLMKDGDMVTIPICQIAAFARIR